MSHARAKAEDTGSASEDSEHERDLADDEKELADGEWPREKEDEVGDKTLCPFCPAILSSADECLAHAKAVHAFDFAAVKAKLALDHYGCIRLINYIRTQQSDDPKPPASAVIATLVPGAMWINDDEFLKPIITDDPLLTDILFDDESDDDDNDDSKSRGGKASGPRSSSGPGYAVPSSGPEAARVLALEEEVLALREQVSQLRDALRGAIADMDSAAPASAASGAPAGEAAAAAATASTTGGTVGGAVVIDRKETPAERRHRLDKRRRKAQSEHDDDYFDGYSGRRIHELMLRDHIRTLAYRDFLMKNKHLVEGKVVLDVGCGTGILSMFAAKAGARMVIGIDKADMIDKAAEIVKTNGVDHIVTLIKSRVEEATLPVPKVDIIISEWMGYFLLFESMLPSVIYARDKWLDKSAPGAGVYPNEAKMFIAGAERKAHNARHVGFWQNVYGFDMSCLIDERERWSGSTVEVIDPKQLFTDSNEIFAINIMEAKGPELDFCYDFKLTAARDESLDAFIVWFDTPFTLHCTTPVMLTTSPASGPTHWMQSVFHLYKALPVKAGDRVVGQIKAHRSAPNCRDYDVQITYHVEPAAAGEPHSKSFVQQFEVTSGEVRLLIDDEYD